MVSKEKFNSERYKVSVTSRHLAITDAIKGYLMEKLSKLDRFAHHILDVNVIVEVQKLTHSVSIVMKFMHYQIKVNASTLDLYSAIDKATDRLIRLVHKYQDKLQHHHVRQKEITPMTINVLQGKDEIAEINESIESENFKETEKLFKLHEIIDKETMPLKRLTQEEAIMKFEFSGDHFFVYKGEEDQKIKILYKRQDENLGLIEVE